MEWVETTGRTIEEAKEAALDELGVDASDAEFEVLEEPRSGLFGRMRTEGRVRARVRPVAPRAKDEHRRRNRPAARREGASAGRGGQSGGEANGPGRDDRDAIDGSDRGDSADAGDASGATESPPGASRGGRRRGSGGGGSGGGDSRVGRPPGADTSESNAGATSGRRGSSEANEDESGAVVGSGGAGGRPSGRRRSSGSKQGGPGGPTDRGSTRGEGDVEVALDEQGQVAEEFLRGLMDEFGVTAEIAKAQPDDDTLDVSLRGDDLGLLIGPRGSTLLALQDLTRTVVQRRTGASNGRIHVDVSGYRQKRSEALTRFARQVADEVVQSGARKALEPMSAPDRKVVHDALTDVDGVSTVSEGEDDRRRVVIVPD